MLRFFNYQALGLGVLTCETQKKQNNILLRPAHGRNEFKCISDIVTGHEILIAGKYPGKLREGT